MPIKVSEQGNVTQVTIVGKVNRKQTILRLSKDEYIKLTDCTGEVLQCVHGDKRTDNAQTLRRTFAKIRALVNTNCADVDKIRWITLTYAENMQDEKRLYRDFDRFMKKYRYRWGECEYIAVAEPQGRGAWHMHVIAIYESSAPFVPNSELAECWGHGFVNVKQPKDVDNLGAYLSAYLGDVELDGTSALRAMREGKQIVEKELKDGTKKCFVKGGRLHMYPSGMNIYRCSRGVIKPTERWITEEEYETLFGKRTPTYANSLEFTTEEGYDVRTRTEFYNSKRDGVMG